METAVISKPVFVLENGIRTIGESNIGRTNIADMVEALSADEFKLVENAEGTRYLHIINNDDQKYFTVKVGKTVDSKKRGNELIRDLIENFVVYSGATENGHWFTFGKVGATGDPLAVMTVKELVKLKVKYYAGS